MIRRVTWMPAKIVRRHGNRVNKICMFIHMVLRACALPAWGLINIVCSCRGKTLTSTNTDCENGAKTVIDVAISSISSP